MTKVTHQKLYSKEYANCLNEFRQNLNTKTNSARAYVRFQSTSKATVVTFNKRGKVIQVDEQFASFLHLLKVFRIYAHVMQ